MKVSLWSSKNLLSAERREPLHIRAIKKAEFSSAFYVRPNILRRLFIAIGGVRLFRYQHGRFVIDAGYQQLIDTVVVDIHHFEFKA